MKANELMIGDLVYGTRIKANTKVVAIDSEYQFKDIIGSVRVLSEDNSFGTWAQYLEPIPLTIEILEQNGFKFNDGMFNWFRSDEDSYYTAFESVRIDVRSGYMRVLKEYKDGKQKKVRCDYSGYVHELQHALRLCGIDKEIEL